MLKTKSPRSREGYRLSSASDGLGLCRRRIVLVLECMDSVFGVCRMKYDHAVVTIVMVRVQRIKCWKEHPFLVLLKMNRERGAVVPVASMGYKLLL